MGLFLTNTELEELTGYKLATKQTNWLQARGYYVETNARGIPRITYTQIEDMRRHNAPVNSLLLSVKPNSTNTIVQPDPHRHASLAAEPNFNSLRQKITKVGTHG